LADWPVWRKLIDRLGATAPVGLSSRVAVIHDSTKALPSPHPGRRPGPAPPPENPQRRNVSRKPMRGKARRVSDNPQRTRNARRHATTSRPGAARFATRPVPQHCRNKELLGAHRCCVVAGKSLRKRNPCPTSG
jgi:hypothetical protein